MSVYLVEVSRQYGMPLLIAGSLPRCILIPE
jgi:hypothetical protein